MNRDYILSKKERRLIENFTSSIKKEYEQNKLTPSKKLTSLIFIQHLEGILLCDKFIKQNESAMKQFKKFHKENKLKIKK